MKFFNNSNDNIASIHWSLVVNLLVEEFFSSLTTTCIIWPSENFLYNLQPNMKRPTIVQIIEPFNLDKSLLNNDYNFNILSTKLETFGINYLNALEETLLISIESGHCEGFVVFQDNIPVFIETFDKVSVISEWRSNRNKFLFVYNKDHPNTESYFQHQFMKDQPNIIVIEGQCLSCSDFLIKRTKYVGKLSSHPEELQTLSVYNHRKGKFTPEIPPLEIYSLDKLRQLEGREVIAAVLHYAPYMIIDYDMEPKYYDHSPDNPTHAVHVNGIETQMCILFCQLHNCTFQVDTSEKYEWGSIYRNLTSEGLLGLMFNNKSYIAVASFYYWHREYLLADYTVYNGRSGVTCIVPAPKKLASWYLPLTPFSQLMWLAVLISILFEMLFLSLMDRFESLWKLSKYFTNEIDCLKNLKYGCGTTFRIYMSQGSRTLLHSVSGRSFLIICYVGSLVLTSIYCGGLASLLTQPSWGEAADSLARFHKHKLKWAATSEDWIFSVGKVDNSNLNLKYFVENLEVLSLEELREAAENSYIAFPLEVLMYGHNANIEFLTEKAVKRFKLMTEDIYYAYTTIVVSKLWALLEVFNNFLLQWHAYGLNEHWEWKMCTQFMNGHIQNQIKYSKYAKPMMEPLKFGLDNVAGIMILWLSGVGLSILIFLYEIRNILIF